MVTHQPQSGLSRHKRAMLKMITWRIVALLSSLIIVYAFTRSFKTSIYLTIVAHLVSSILYYAHERLWELTTLV